MVDIGKSLQVDGQVGAGFAGFKSDAWPPRSRSQDGSTNSVALNPQAERTEEMLRLLVR